MVGIYIERRSRAAIWCQRFALVLIPFFAATILLFRFSRIEPLHLAVLISIGLVIALFSIVFGIRALVDLWSKGYRGGSQVIRGMIITSIILLPFGYQIFLGLRHPLANDVSTDTFNPPQYVNVAKMRANAASEGINPVMEYTDEYADMIVAAYPKLRSRRYPAGPDRVLEAVRNIISQNEWRVTGSQGIPEPRSEPEGSDGQAGGNTGDGQPVEENAEVPDDIYIEAVERTFVFGFENDVVVRIVSEAENTLVDVRSSARLGRHDFGYNAKLIEDFLEQLDTALLGIAGEG